jgi:hypothetical protein
LFAVSLRRPRPPPLPTRPLRQLLRAHARLMRRIEPSRVRVFVRVGKGRAVLIARGSVCRIQPEGAKARTVNVTGEERQMRRLTRLGCRPGPSGGGPSGFDCFVVGVGFYPWDFRMRPLERTDLFEGRDLVGIRHDFDADHDSPKHGKTRSACSEKTVGLVIPTGFSLNKTVPRSR